MQHEISQKEATAIQRARAEQAEQARKEREKAELNRWLDEQESRAGTQ